MKKLPEKALLRADEVAQFWGVSKKTVYFWIDQGQLPALKRGGTIRIRYEEAKKGRRTDDE